jgi:hypothetical protein
MASRNASFTDDVFLRALLMPASLLLRLSVFLMLLLAGSWLVHWACATWVWADGGTHLQILLKEEYRRGVALASMQGAGGRELAALPNCLYWLLFKASGIHEMGLRFADPAALSIPDTVARSQYIGSYGFIQVAMEGTQLVGLRLAVIARWLPVVALLYLVGILDGLVQRQLRTTGGGSESSSLYHRAKYLQVVIGMCAIAAVSVWPAPINWRVVGFALCVVLAVAGRIQAGYYKKYL